MKITGLQKVSLGTGIVVLGVVLAGLVGWCLNVYKLTQLDFNTPYRAEVIRAVGLFPLVGALTGYLNIED